MRTLWRILAGTVKWTWRLINFVREFILNLFLLLVVLVGVGIYYQVQQFQTPPTTPQKGALLVNLSGVIVERPAVNNQLQQLTREMLGASNRRMQENPLFDLVDNIRRAKDDDNINGMVLALNDFAGADQPSLQYIGKALREFRDSGKNIIAIGDSYSQSQYYLASFANKIYLSPQGAVDLHGFATNGLYYKSLLEKLDVSTHIFRVGTYKSAVEPLLRDDMSPEARAADSRWLGLLWQNYLQVVSANRQLTPEQLFPGAKGIVAGLQATQGDMARYALNNKLVDELASRESVEQMLVKTFKWDQQEKSYRHVSIYDYRPKPKTQTGDKIAVVFADGAIIDGVDTTGAVGGDSVAQQLREARLDKQVKAVILRVNSPGGSVSASEVIRSELAAVRAAGKPVVVSMGGMAASGGYWISTPADRIIASPSTLTGSIGIFGVINTFENSLANIGVHTDGVATSELADIAITKALPEAFSQIVQMSVENGYQNFIGLVAKARNKTPEQIDQIAQGRVWIGSDAKANGLVDSLGDFDDAVKQAAELAKLTDYQLSWSVGEQSKLEMLLSQMNASVQALLPSALQGVLPAPVVQVVSALNNQPGLSEQFNDPQHRYAICLNCGDIR